MPRHVAAQQALLLLQDISADCSDGECSDSEDTSINDVEDVVVDSSGEEDSDIDSSSKYDYSDLQGQVYVDQDLIGKDGMVWNALAFSHVQQEHLQQQNVLSFKSGPTAYAANRIVGSSPLTSFRMLFDEAMLRNIRKCTVAEAHHVSGNTNWDVTLDELDKFIGLVVARGILGKTGMPVESLWDTIWGCPLFNKTLSRNRFKEIMRFLRFDMKSDRQQRLIHDRFCLASSLWNTFIENSQKAYVPSSYITIDEQLLPCKARCRFIQYMPNKPDKFGLKFWMAIDAETKYLYNSFPYLGKDESRDTSVSLPTNVVMKLMQPIFKRGYDVSCDNIFSSSDIAPCLSDQKCSIVGTAPQNRIELPQADKKKQQQHETSLFASTQTVTNVTLTSYQCKKQKSVIMLSTLHPEVEIPSQNNSKKKPETVLFYNKTKAGVDVIDQMTRKYSVKAASRRWPIHVFYNVIDLALINSWILFKDICKSNISRQKYIQCVAEELTGATPVDNTRKTAAAQRYRIETDEPPEKKRRTCTTSKCRNRTLDMCNICHDTVCGKCAIKLCPKCVD